VSTFPVFSSSNRRPPSPSPLAGPRGVPLHQSRGEYCAMDPALKRALPDLLRRHAPQYGLPEVSFASFERKIGPQRVGRGEVASE